MEIEASLDAQVSAKSLFRVVEDLALYPRWLDMVRRAEPTAPSEDDEGPAWDVELRGRIGPLARSKRLRMVRTQIVEGTHVLFERREGDGREHSTWVLEANVGEVPEESGAARLTMVLRYSGSFATGVLKRLLKDEIERARPRLVALATELDAGRSDGSA